MVSDEEAIFAELCDLLTKAEVAYWLLFGNDNRPGALTIEGEARALTGWIAGPLKDATRRRIAEPAARRVMGALPASVWDDAAFWARPLGQRLIRLTTPQSQTSVTASVAAAMLGATRQHTLRLARDGRLELARQGSTGGGNPSRITLESVHRYASRVC